MSKFGKGEAAMSNIVIGTRIRELRESSKLTREELADKAEISTKFLYEIETGKKGLSAETLLKIADALSCSCDYILTGKNIGKEKFNIMTNALDGFDERQLKRIAKVLKLIREIYERK